MSNQRFLDLSGYKLRLSYHARLRMFKRGIKISDVKSILTRLQLVEERHWDTPYPTQLLLGWVDQRPLHVVVALPPGPKEVIVVTTYDPSEEAELWSDDYSQRKPG